MNKYCAKIFICLLMLGITCECYANSNFINNALIQSNIYLKQAGLVQEKYSGIARDITSKKVSPDSLIGKDAAALKKKAEKKMRSAESLKEKAEKYQKYIEYAKKSKAQLEAKYNEYNEKYMQKYADAMNKINEGRSILNDYQTKVQDGLKKVNELKDEVKEFKNDVDKLKDKHLPDEEISNETTDEEGKSAEAEEENIEDEIPNENIVENYTPQNTNVSAEVFLQKNKVNALDNTIKNNEPDIISAKETFVPAQEVDFMISNQADAIISAGEMAGNVAEEIKEAIVEPNMVPISSVSFQDVSVEDVMSAPVLKGEMPKQKSIEIKTDKGLVEQLVQSSSKRDVKELKKQTEGLIEAKDVKSIRDKFIKDGDDKMLKKQNTKEIKLIPKEKTDVK